MFVPEAQTQVINLPNDTAKCKTESQTIPIDVPCFLMSVWGDFGWFSDDLQKNNYFEDDQRINNYY